MAFSSLSEGDVVGHPDNENGVCDIGARPDVTFVPYGDGEPYCLHIVAEEITATLAEGSRLI